VDDAFASVMFRDGQKQDVQGLWSFGVNGFFVPPPEFAGILGIANGTIIPTAAVGVFCGDGFGGCAIELTAVIGGNLGIQVFNVSFNKVRFVSNQCRYRVSPLGRVVITASFQEVSSRLISKHSLSPPIVLVVQLASNSFGFVEVDQLFVLEGEFVRIQRFNVLFNTLNGNNNNWPQSSVNTPSSPSPATPSVASSTLADNSDNSFRVSVCPALLREGFAFGRGQESGGATTPAGVWGGSDQAL